jgi:CBS domain-containing protein
MKVKDLMTRFVVMVKPETTVLEAMGIMMEEGISCILVVTEDPYRELGIVTRFDVLGKVVARGKDPKEMKVTEIMETEIATTDPDRDIREVCEEMFRRRYWRMPVVKEGRIVGILSGTDIFRSAL